MSPVASIVRRILGRGPEDQEVSPEALRSILRSLAICGLFCFLSTWTTLYNKYIFENVFASSNCLLFVQNVVTLLALLLGRWLKIVEFTPSFGFGDVICGLAYSINVMTGLWSLVYVSIAMFSTLKRGTVVVSWVLEYFVSPTPTTRATLPPLVAMIIGGVLAGAYDLQFSLAGYILSGISCIAQGSAYELGRRMTVSNKGVCSVLLVNSTMAIGLQLFLIGGTGEIGLLSPTNLKPSLVFHFSLNSLSCLLMNYSIFLNCQVNSPLAHSVTGNIKAYATTLIGVLLFTSKLEMLGWIGILLNCIGAGWFSYVKLQYNVRAAQAAVENKSTPPDSPSGVTIIHRQHARTDSSLSGSRQAMTPPPTTSPTTTKGKGEFVL